MFNKIFTSILVIFILYSCSKTIPTNVMKSDTQKVTSIEYGTIKASIPVKIKGESNWIGVTAGAMIGGRLGTQVCGEDEVIGTKCQDIGVVFGSIGGAALGTVIQSTLGNHDGFQYVVNIDNKDKDSAFVQGDKKPLINGQRVIIIYGNDVRVLPFEE